MTEEKIVAVLMGYDDYYDQRCELYQLSRAFKNQKGIEIKQAYLPAGVDIKKRLEGREQIVSIFSRLISDFYDLEEDMPVYFANGVKIENPGRGVVIENLEEGSASYIQDEISKRLSAVHGKIFKVLEGQNLEGLIGGQGLN